MIADIAMTAGAVTAAVAVTVAIVAIAQAADDDDLIVAEYAGISGNAVGTGLIMNRYNAAAVLRYGEVCLPPQWKKNSFYSTNEVSSVELSFDTSLNARVAAITKRLTSKVEEAADGTGAVYELEYMLIEDSL